MSEPKEYKIETVQDMIDCTNKDNIDCFLLDLKRILLMSHAYDAFGCKFDKFIWVDDGKNEFEIKIKDDTETT